MVCPDSKSSKSSTLQAWRQTKGLSRVPSSLAQYSENFLGTPWALDRAREIRVFSLLISKPLKLGCDCFLMIRCLARRQAPSENSPRARHLMAASLFGMLYGHAGTFSLASSTIATLIQLAEASDWLPCSSRRSSSCPTACLYRQPNLNGVGQLHAATVSRKGIEAVMSAASWCQPGPRHHLFAPIFPLERNRLSSVRSTSVHRSRSPVPT